MRDWSARVSLQDDWDSIPHQHPHHHHTSPSHYPHPSSSPPPYLTPPTTLTHPSHYPPLSPGRHTESRVTRGRWGRWSSAGPPCSSCRSTCEWTGGPLRLGLACAGRRVRGLYRVPSGHSDWNVRLQLRGLIVG